MKLFFRFLFVSVMTLVFFSSNAQVNEEGIGRFFTEYETFTFDTKKMYETSKKYPNDFFEYEFQLTENYNWDLELHHSQIYADNYILTDGGKVYQKNEIPNLPTVLNGVGTSSNDIRPTITVNNGFLYGIIKTRTGNIYFEPLNTFDKSAKEDEYVVYHENDVIHFEGNFCAAKDHESKRPDITFEEQKTNSNNYRDGQCLTVEYALANDSYVYASRGSNTANWNAGIVADLNSDYDDSFADEIRFVIVETYISQNTSQDEWGNTNDLLQLLENFRNWNNSGSSGFTNGQDLAGIWSDNTYTGGTIGWASVGAVCSQFRYHSLRDYGGSAAGYRNLVSHEIGHNFNLSHLSEGGFVMSPSVSGTTSWHSNSISAIRTYYDGLSCLSACSGGPPPPTGDEPVANFGATLLSECNPTQIQMVDQSTNTPTSWAWQFESGSPGSSNQQNPIVNFPGGGDYTVTLTATNTHGSDTKILIMTLNVGTAPSANYSYSISGNTVNFSNSSSGADTYNWTFGDGNGSTATHPSHTFSGPGTYSVSLLASNDCGNDTETKSIIIIDNVTAAFIAASTSDCKGETIQFTNQSSSNVTSFSWEFEGGTPSTSTAENPNVTYNNSGTFNAKLTVSNSSASAIENKINYISISDVPNAAYTYSKNGYTVTFDNNTVGGTTYSWDFGDGNTSSSANPTHTYASHGVYTVVLTSNNSCGSDDTNQGILLEEFVTAAFTSDIQSGCEGQVVEFTSTSTGGVTSYFWEFEDGTPSSSTDQNPTIVYNTDGNFNVKLTVSNSSSSDTKTEGNYISITGAPNTQFTYFQDEYTFEFDNNTVGGLTYFWDFGDGISSTEPNPNHTYTSPGSYIVSLTSTNLCDEEQTALSVSIDEIVEASFESSSNLACVGQTIEFTNTSFGDIAIYSWEFEGGSPSTSDQEHPIVTYNSAGDFNVKLTVEGVYGTQDVIELSNNITVSEYAEAGFSYVLDGFTLTFNNLSSSYDNLSWNFGDGLFSSSENPIHTYIEEGNYTVILTVENDCGTDEKEVIIPVFDQLLANFQASKTIICPGEEVQLQDLSSGNPTQWSWVIEGLSMITAEEQNPMITLMDPGIYTVELTVSNSEEQNSKVENQYLEVMALPAANFTYLQEDLSFTFQNESEDGVSYLWDFGDGNTSSLISPQHEYETEGDYIVTLEVLNDCFNDVMEVELGVYERLIAGFSADNLEICSENTVQFTDRSSGNATSWTWAFPGGIPSTSAEQNPIVTYANPGNFDVTLQVNNETEEVFEERVEYISVLETPNVEINTLIENYTVQFSTVEIGAEEIFWEFGDGNSSSELNPSYEYTAEGIYEVQLIISNICGLDTFLKEVKIQNEIELEFSSENFEICPDETVSFIENTSKNVLTWEWILPGSIDESSQEKNPTVKYSVPGTYDVTLKVTSLFDEKEITLVNYVQVLDSPIADFEYQLNRDSVQFFNISQHGSSFEWLFDNEGTSNELSPTFIFSEEKIYEISLITTNNCSSDTITQLVDLIEESNAYANFSIAQNSYCLGDIIQFIDLSSEDITEWSWKFDGGIPAISDEKDPEIMYSSFGSYDVELTVSNGFNTRTIMLEKYVTIIEKPLASFELTQTNNEIELANLSQHVNKYFWDFGDGNTSGGENASHIYNSNGNFPVTLKVENSCGEAEYEEEVSIVVFPKAGFSLDIAQGCSPLTVNFENRSTENSDAIVWILEGIENEAIAEDNPSVVYEIPGNYGLKVVASNSFGSDTITLQEIIEVYESPIIEIGYSIEGFDVNFEATISNYDSLIWDFGDESYTSEMSPTHSYISGGTFEVKLSAHLGDCITEEIIELSLSTTSINDLDEFDLVEMFPNPTSGRLKIDFNNQYNVHSIKVLDQLGRQFFTQTVDEDLSEIEISLDSGIPSGNYVVIVNLVNERPILKKLVVAK